MWLDNLLICGLLQFIFRNHVGKLNIKGRIISRIVEIYQFISKTEIDRNLRSIISWDDVT